MREMLHGSKAVAKAVKLCDVDVVAAYPITPQTPIVEYIAQMVADGELRAEYIMVESEHTAMSACIGASATGARTFTATSSQGLAYMHEVLFIASGMRLPIVMVNANRALSAPINIWNDQSDSIAERDSGWVQIYVETNQEALDSVIQAYRIAEDKEVLLPVMVCMDGFVLTHTMEPVDVPSQEEVSGFIPPFEPELKLDPEQPVTMGALGEPQWYMEFRKQQDEAMERALEKVKEVDLEFARTFGRGYGLIEEYKTEDAEVVLLTMGSLAGTIKDVVDRYEGVGLVRLRLYRPLPVEEIARAIGNAAVVGVLEKDIALGLGEGALCTEVKKVCYDRGLETRVLSFVCGLGGRDVRMEDVEHAIEVCRRAAKGEKVSPTTWLGLREAVP
ncbi:MAG: pyruvate ferredoxin oxidoreductase [Euryarchaeota archaeon]|nr:pyruvate ferredoxin oxidoreductase [Euryarchaeota archaeon]